uniref:Uncharacterized protein n=1 Tax=viral metagenome TaxID=1070528 RepID=A0A6M3KQJ1_9ZZZZ
MRYWCEKYRGIIDKGKALNNCLLKGCPELIRVNSWRLRQLKKEKKI